MQLSSKLLFRTAILMLGVLLAASLLVVVTNANNQANAALSNTVQWDMVRTAVDNFFTGQYDKGVDGVAGTADDPAQGEAGFLMNRTTLKSRLDSNNNWDLTAANAPAQILGEGDDAANAPVLVDNLVSKATTIPGTSVRCDYNGSYGTANCFDPLKVTEIMNRVNAHAAAGFSTDIAVYCQTARTESLTTGGIGPLAQTGALGKAADGITNPKVMAFKWGRNGWTGTSTTTTAVTGVTGSVPAASTTYPSATNPTPCNSYSASEQETVRCAAQWALYNGVGDPDWGGSGYNITNGVTAFATSNQVIDVRNPSPSSTVTFAGAPTTVQIPINTVFNSGLSYISARTSATKNVFVGRTHMVPAMAAVGSAMLGYNSTYYVWGVNSYNTSLGGESYQTSVAGSLDTPTYPLLVAVVGSQTSTVDQSAPTITTGPTVSSVTTTSADISRTASEPATSKIHLVGSDGHIVDANNTVLNASKTVSLGGLHDGVTYTGTLTVYDGQANGTSAAVSFSTPSACVAGKPSLSLAAPVAFWFDYPAYVARDLSITWTVNNTGATTATNVAITSSASNYAQVTTTTGMPVTVGTGTIAPSSSGSATIHYHVPVGVGSFHVINTASATDCASNLYTYP